MARSRRARTRKRSRKKRGGCGAGYEPNPGYNPTAPLGWATGANNPCTLKGGGKRRRSKRDRSRKRRRGGGTTASGLACGWGINCPPGAYGSGPFSDPIPP